MEINSILWLRHGLRSVQKYYNIFKFHYLRVENEKISNFYTDSTITQLCWRQLKMTAASAKLHSTQFLSLMANQQVKFHRNMNF
jgi:hypothetical protein